MGSYANNDDDDDVYSIIKDTMLHDSTRRTSAFLVENRLLMIMMTMLTIITKLIAKPAQLNLSCALD